MYISEIIGQPGLEPVRVHGLFKDMGAWLEKICETYGGLLFVSTLMKRSRN